MKSSALRSSRVPRLLRRLAQVQLIAAMRTRSLADLPVKVLAVAEAPTQDQASHFQLVMSG